MAYKNQKKNKIHSNALRKENRHFKNERKRERKIDGLVEKGYPRMFAKLMVS